jgi:hypothetical protein
VGSVQNFETIRKLFQLLPTLRIADRSIPFAEDALTWIAKDSYRRSGSEAHEDDCFLMVARILMLVADDEGVSGRQSKNNVPVGLKQSADLLRNFEKCVFLNSP